MTSHLYSLDLGRYTAVGRVWSAILCRNSVSLLTAGAALWGHHKGTATATSEPIQAPCDPGGQWSGNIVGRPGVETKTGSPSCPGTCEALQKAPAWEVCGEAKTSIYTAGHCSQMVHLAALRTSWVEGAGFEIDSSHIGCYEVCKDALVRRKTGGLSDQGHRLSPPLQPSASWPVSWGSEHKGEVSRLNASETSKLFS